MLRPYPRTVGTGLRDLVRWDVPADVARRDVALLSIGSVGTLVVLPFFVEHYFHGNKIVTAVALVGAGLLLVAVGSAVIRRRRSPTALV